MPHNRTRLWVGLAIIAVTIPAVGTYYMRPKGSPLQGAPIEVVGRSSVVSLSGSTSYSSPPVAQIARRDYLAEVQQAADQGGAASSSDEGEDYDDFVAMEDEMFDISPLPNDVRVNPPYDPAGEPPYPTTNIAPEPSGTVASATDGPVADTIPDDAVVADEQGTPTLTDANVYQIVVNNLNADDREEFVRAYAAMTPAQRADLLEGFRTELENDGTQ